MDYFVRIPDGHKFQSTPPMQGATQDALVQAHTLKFQSTPPMQGATSSSRRYTRMKESFNPRPLCRERPYSSFLSPDMPGSFNPRPLCRERLGGRDYLTGMYAKFQSTPPMQGATKYLCSRNGRQQFQSTPPMQGATVKPAGNTKAVWFQSTPPMQGATGFQS